MAGENGAQGEQRESSTHGAAPSGTVTFLFTDIEGSTRLLERLRGRYADVLADQRKILRAAFNEWHGHEIDTQGDSFFVAFGRAADALHCAIDAQRALAAWQWPEKVAVRVRMGLHTGEPIVAATGYVGMDVHRAARVAAAGHGGQILVSRTTRDLISDELSGQVKLRDLGQHRLKDLRGETHLFQVEAHGLPADFPPLSSILAEEPPPTPGEPPYRGLQVFEEADADVFFGREEVVDQLAEQVGRARFVALIGASGSGKSSILRAGLIPALRRGKQPWLIHLLTPTAHPLEALATAVLPDASGAEVAALASDLRGDPASLAIALRRKRSGFTGRTLIAVDQLEEVFTLCRDETARKAILTSLIQASGLDDGPASTAPDGDRATVVITLRADFYAFLAPYSPLRDASAASQRYVGAMSADELRRAIEEPARTGDWLFVPGLVDLLLRDVGDEPGALPLLSHALLETWQRRRGTSMTLPSYAESGGVTGAIARTADRVYENELTEDEQRIARGIFLRLTELGEGTQDTRRRARLGELISRDEQQAASVQAVIGALADARLVTVDEDVVQVAHEALIREWPTLREWLRADRDALRLHRRLTEAAREWELAGFDEELLFRGARLAQAHERLSFMGAMNELERRFLDASIALAEREEAEREEAHRREIEAAQTLAAAETRRAEEAARSAAGLRRRAVMLVGALVVAAVLAGVAIVLARQSADNAALAEQNAAASQENAELAQRREVEARDSADEAQRNVELADQREAEARANFLTGQSQRLGAEADSILVRGGDPELAALLALAGLRSDYTFQADAALQRAARTEPARTFQHPAGVLDVAVTPDGETLVTASGGSLYLWNPENGELTDKLDLAHEESGDLQLSSDGTVLMVKAEQGSAELYRISDGTASPVAGCPSLSANATRAMSDDGRLLAEHRWQRVQLPNRPFGTATVLRTEDCSAIGVPIDVGLGDIAISPDGSLIAGTASGSDVSVAVWDVESGDQRFAADAGGGQFRDVQFSPDGQYVATAHDDGTARLFDVAAGSLEQVLRGHSGPLFQVRFSADGKQLITASSDRTARLWDIESGLELESRTHEGVVAATVSQDNTFVFTASADGTARRWSTSGQREGFSYRAGAAEVSGLGFSPDGQLLATGSGDRVQIHVLADGGQILDATRTGSISKLAFSLDGQKLLATTENGSALSDVETGDEIYAIQGARSGGSGIAAAFGGSPVGTRFLAGSPDLSSLGLYETATGRLASLIDGRAGVISADGTRLATWRPGEPGNYLIYEAETLEDPVQGFVPEAWRRLTSIHATEPAVPLVLSADGSLLIAGEHDNVVRAFDLESGQVVMELRGHAGRIRDLALTNDDAYLVTASDDGTARVWDLRTGASRRVLVGRGAVSVTAITVAPDNKTVALGMRDGTVLVAPLQISDLEAAVCSSLSRDLSDEERMIYGIEEAVPACP